eukprot:1161782-Pelagomonas_calceolata.AAC.3
MTSGNESGSIWGSSSQLAPQKPAMIEVMSVMNVCVLGSWCSQEMVLVCLYSRDCCCLQQLKHMHSFANVMRVLCSWSCYEMVLMCHYTPGAAAACKILVAAAAACKILGFCIPVQVYDEELGSRFMPMDGTLACAERL